MTPELWQRVAKAISELSSLEPSRRAAELDRLRQSDPELADEVASLLSQPTGIDLDSAIDQVWQVVGHDKATAPPEQQPLKQIGPYALQERVGKGGMGEVWRAKDQHFRRSLAIKVFALQCDDKKQQAELQRRFVEEAQLMAQLQHPGIPPVHDRGELPDGRPYFAMKLIRGKTLAALLKERSDPGEDQPRLLAIFEQICQTVAYAHAQGIIHRDLKPANVMIGAFGEVQVMDWGLAKVLGERGTIEEPAGQSSTICTVRTESPDPTQAGQVMGSLAYMAPEQARGEVAHLDERCDVFGLGAILCEILTGSPPYVGTRAGEVHELAKAARIEPALARLDGSAEQELVQFAGRCLAAVKEQRPANGKEVAQAMSGYLAGVQRRLQNAMIAKAAAKATTTEARKRFRVTVLLGGILILALLAGTIISTLFAAEAKDRADAEFVARQDAVQQTAIAQENEKQATGNLKRALAAENAAKDARWKEYLGSYATTIALAASEYENGKVTRARDLLGRFVPAPGEKDIRDFEWHYLWELTQDQKSLRCVGHKGAVKTVQYSPDGAAVYSAALDGTIKKWDAATGQPNKTVSLNLGRGGAGLRLDEKEGQMVVTSVVPGGAAASLAEPLRPGDRITAIVGQDGTLIMTAGRKLTEVVKLLAGEPNTKVGIEIQRKGMTQKQRHLLTRQLLLPYPEVDFAANIDVMTLSPDCLHLATSGKDGIVLWEVANGRLKHILAKPAASKAIKAQGDGKHNNVSDLIFSPDGQWLTETTVGETRRVWQAATGKLKAVLPGDQFGVQAMAAAFLSDNHSLLAAQSGGFRVWDLDQPDRPPRLLIDDVSVFSSGNLLAVSPNGRWIATCRNVDAHISVYETGQAGPRAILKGHRDWIRQIVFCHDGRVLASASKDGTIRLWNIAQGIELATLRGLEGRVESVHFRPDNRALVAAGSEGVLAIWDLEHNTPFDLLIGASERAFSGAVAFTNNNQTCVASSQISKGEFPRLDAWSRKTARRLPSPLDQPSGIHWLTVAGAGKTLAVLESDINSFPRTRVSLWDTSTWERRESIEHPELPYGHMIALSQDGHYLAVSASTHPPARSFDEKPSDVWRANQVIVYERQQGAWQPKAVLAGFHSSVFLLEFSANGKRLITVEWQSGTASLWDWRNGKVVTKFAASKGMIQSLAIAPDDKIVVLAIGGFLNQMGAAGNSTPQK